MHKFFAKTLFLGKKVVFLPQCHSTNDELLELVRNSNESEGMVLYTADQTKGRGQRGNSWLTESGKNILMSLLLRPKFLSPQNQFYLNLITGLALIDILRPLIKGDLFLKWPNDVYVNEKKIAGVLIESNIRSNSIESAIVGIGLNVNQKGFNIPNATSLALETTHSFELEELMENLLLYLEKWYLKLKSNHMDLVLDKYHEVLMWRGEVRTFGVKDQKLSGEIIGIDKHGRLAVNHSGKLNYYGIKEIEFIG